MLSASLTEASCGEKPRRVALTPCRGVAKRALGGSSWWELMAGVQVSQGAGEPVQASRQAWSPFPSLLAMVAAASAAAAATTPRLVEPETPVGRLCQDQKRLTTQTHPSSPPLISSAASGTGIPPSPSALPRGRRRGEGGGESSSRSRGQANVGSEDKGETGFNSARCRIQFLMSLILSAQTPFFLSRAKREIGGTKKKLKGIS